MARRAERQHGNVTHAQLRRLGLSDDQIDQRRECGWLIPRHRTVYAVGHVPRSRSSRWMAATLAVGGHAVLSHRAAGAHWEIVRGAVPTEVTVPTYAGFRHRDRIVVHRAALPRTHVTTRDFIRTTTVLRTVLDLGAILSNRRLERAFEQAQVLYHLDPVEVAAELECRRGYRGTARVRAIMEGAVDPAAVRSVLELRFLELCAACSIPRPLINTQMGRWRPDFLWPDSGLVVETDSRAFHASIAAHKRDLDKDEELARLGVRVVRLRWRDVVEDPAATANRLRAELAVQASVAPTG